VTRVKISTFPALGGDPTPAGWAITAFYAIASGGCLFALLRARARSRALPHAGIQQEIRGWSAVLAANLFFGVNKQLDLQTWLTRLGRGLARQEGWFEWRRELQLLFMFCVAVATLTVFALIWMVGRRHRISAALRIAFVGEFWLGLFYLIRGMSFHHVDAWLHVRLPGANVRDLLEATGLIIVFAAAMSFVMQRRSQPCAMSSVEREPLR
jgi:hypothetical protein